MYQTISVVIVAGGTGQRMGSAIPKQFLPIGNKPILYYSINAFKMAFPQAKLILVLPEQYFSYSNMVLQAFNEPIDLTIVKGGATRFHSVQQGLKEVDESDVVFIHDAVRPFISIPLLHRCYEQAICQGSAIPAINTVESMRYFNGVAYEIIDRAALKVIQTPQTFQAALVKKAFNQEYNTAFTDEASVVEYGGGAVHLIEGEKHNIKITTPEDILLAEAILNLEQEN